MATDFLNDARREIEGRTEDFYGELKAFYQGNAKAEQNLMEQTTQPFWQSLCLSGKRLQQRDLTVDMEMQEPDRCGRRITMARKRTAMITPAIGPKL